MRTALTNVSGRATSRTRPSAIAAQIASGFGSASMSEFSGSVPDQLPSFLYRLRDESPLAGSIGVTNYL